MSGAPSHVDTFDPKDGPWNPRDIDIQQYGSILLSRRLFPMLSGLTSELCILRSVTSWEAAHSRGQFYLQTSHTFNPAFAPALPHIGAVTSFAGAYVSYFLDGATGGIIVVLQTLIFLAAFVFAPKHGMLANRRKGRLALEHGRAPL